MGNQVFDRAKKTLAILLVVLFVTTLTVTLVSAKNPTAVGKASVTSQKVKYNSDQSTPGSGVIDTWKWEFDDGTTANIANPAHTYFDGDGHTAKLTVWDSNGGFDSTSVTTNGCT